MESFEDKLNGTVPPLVIGICILLILLGIGKLTDYLDDRKQEQCDELMSGRDVFDLNPTREQLSAIVNHKRFTQTPKKLPRCCTWKTKSL